MNASQQLAQWIESEHPDFFTHLHAGVIRAYLRGSIRRSRLNGFGDDLVSGDNIVSGDGSLDPSVFAAPSVDLTAPEVDLTGGSSTGWLSSIGSGISDAASSVGNWLTQGGGLNSLASLGSTYFKTQATTQIAQNNAQLQTAVLQAQVARTQAGQLPAPVSYVQSANGQIVPVYTGSVNTYPVLQNAISAGQSRYIDTGTVSGYTVPSNMVSTLGPGISMQQVLPWALLIGGAVLLASHL